MNNNILFPVRNNCPRQKLIKVESWNQRENNLQFESVDDYEELACVFNIKTGVWNAYICDAKSKTMDCYGLYLFHGDFQINENQPREGKRIWLFEDIIDFNNISKFLVGDSCLMQNSFDCIEYSSLFVMLDEEKQVIGIYLHPGQFTQ